jgi:hypothetical protein
MPGGGRKGPGMRPWRTEDADAKAAHTALVHGPSAWPKRMAQARPTAPQHPRPPAPNHASGNGRNAKQQQQRGGDQSPCWRLLWWRPARQPKTGKRPGSDAQRRSASARRKVAARQGKGGRPSSPRLGRTRPRPGSRPEKGILNTPSITCPMHDAPFGYTGRAQISWNVLATIGAPMH